MLEIFVCHMMKILLKGRPTLTSFTSVCEFSIGTSGHLGHTKTESMGFFQLNNAKISNLKVCAIYEPMARTNLLWY